MERAADWRLGHRPALDGVRGVAILLVLVSHSVTFQLLRGGATTGVTLFFVLSGFLITALLAQEQRDTGRIDLWAFYRRRALRLLPALLVLITVLFTVTELASHRLDTPRLEEPTNTTEMLVTLFYASNWFLIYEHHHTLALLNHAWSLSIEEQFYLVWPALLIVGISLFGLKSRRLLRAVFALTALSAVEGAWLYWSTSGNAGGRIYFGTDTRADALLLGAALALWLVSGRRLQVPSVVLLLGLGLIAISTSTGDPVAEKLPALAILGGVVVIAGVLQDGWAGAILSWKPLRWTGRISYGLYLWHYPIILLLQPHLLGQTRLVQLAILGLVSYAAAVASYYLVERYFLRLKSRSARVPVASTPAVVGAC